MRAVILASLAFLVGCDGGVNSGPLAFGIVSGNNQTATAGSDRLTNPVVGKLVRTPDGGITFNLVRSAYAQGTVVNGSPVPGAVVCAVSISENGMVPWVPCTNTDSAGTATFFFTPGTRADTVRSEIRGTVEGEPTVFDTASAVVEPGRPTWFGNVSYSVPEGDTLNLSEPSQGIDARDAFNNEIPVEMLVARWTPSWTIIETDPHPSVQGNRVCSDPERVVGSGDGWLMPAPPRFMPEPYTSSSYCLRIAIEGQTVGRYHLGVMHP
jgi:hypothetical protein